MSKCMAAPASPSVGPWFDTEFEVGSLAGSKMLICRLAIFCLPMTFSISAIVPRVSRFGPCFSRDGRVTLSSAVVMRADVCHREDMSRATVRGRRFPGKAIGINNDDCLYASLNVKALFTSLSSRLSYR